MVWGPEDGERYLVSGRLGFKKGFRRPSYLIRLPIADFGLAKPRVDKEGF